MRREDLEWRKSIEGHLAEISSSVKELRDVRVDEHERLARIELSQEQVTKVLCGNGQPSRCDQEQAQIRVLENSAAVLKGAPERIRALEDVSNRMKGSAATLGALAGFIVFLARYLLQEVIKMLK